ncbi:MAG: type II toxin-antitoxin system death-on-curing family toxin [Anaerovibrio sp.]|nr:type II toxin-antitoxin system death-on-curing family toxin [Anaerovibrio sp.]
MSVHTIPLLLADILAFHDELEKEFAMESGIHDMGLLESAVHAPFQTFGSQDLYPDTYDKAARLCFGLAKNHPFRDGNKRTAVHAMLVYLRLNNILLKYDSIELENTIIAVADGSLDRDNLARWLKEHTKI